MKKVMLLFSLMLITNLIFAQTEKAVEERTETERVAPPPPPPPPPPPTPRRAEIFKVVEEMPAFPGCEDKTDRAEKKKCSIEKMNTFIYDNLRYPKIAKENGVEGTVVVRFAVEKDGSLSNPEVVRDIGAQCGAEALRIVKSMPKWNPGKQRGRPVRVQFNLPVKFKL
jgi:protein TonB